MDAGLSHCLLYVRACREMFWEEHASQLQDKICPTMLLEENRQLTGKLSANWVFFCILALPSQTVVTAET